MIDYIKYRYKLEQLFRQKKRLWEAYDTDIQIARKEGKPKEDIELLECEAWSEKDRILEDISILITDYLINRATRKFVPIPSLKEMEFWERCKVIHNRYILTDTGIRDLRSSLRLEQKERNESLVPIIAALTGIIGAATGLVALLLK